MLQFNWLVCRRRRKKYLQHRQQDQIRSEHISRNGEPGSVDTAQPFKTVENMTNVVGLDFDYKSGRLYYTQVSLLKKTIFSLSLTLLNKMFDIEELTKIAFDNNIAVW